MGQNSTFYENLSQKTTLQNLKEANRLGFWVQILADIVLDITAVHFVQRIKCLHMHFMIISVRSH